MLGGAEPYLSVLFHETVVDHYPLVDGGDLLRSFGPFLGVGEVHPGLGYEFRRHDLADLPDGRVQLPQYGDLVRVVLLREGHIRVDHGDSFSDGVLRLDGFLDHLPGFQHGGHQVQSVGHVGGYECGERASGPVSCFVR